MSNQASPLKRNTGGKGRGRTYDFYLIAHEHLCVFRKPAEGEDFGLPPNHEAVLDPARRAKNVVAGPILARGEGEAVDDRVLGAEPPRAAPGSQVVLVLRQVVLFLRRFGLLLCRRLLLPVSSL